MTLSLRLLSLSIVLAAAACAPGSRQPAATSVPQQSSSETRIAAVGPMSGTYAQFGKQIREGVELAVADINAAGGVLGKKLVLEVADDRCEPARAVDIAEDLADEGVVLVVGHFCSGASIPASKIYAANRVLQITPASSNPRLTREAADRGWTNVFRTCGADDRQGEFASRYVIENHRGRNVAILHDNGNYGRMMAEATRSALNAAGVEAAVYRSFAQGQKDFDTLVADLNAKEIDVAYIGGFYTEAALIVREARRQGVETQFIGPDSLATDAFMPLAGPAGEGTMFSFAPDPRKAAAAQDLMSRARAQGLELRGYALNAYAAVQVFAEAARRANSLDQAALSRAIRGQSFETVLGTLTYDQIGDIVDAPWVWYSHGSIEIEELGFGS